MITFRNRLKEKSDLPRQISNNFPPSKLSSHKLLPISLDSPSNHPKFFLPHLPQKSETQSPVPRFLSPIPGSKIPSSSISSPKLTSLPPLLASVKSNKPHGVVQLYCANTHRGIIREYNEDRVMIVTRIRKPTGREDERWPNCSFFGLYDGHGGKLCSNYLRDNLHHFIINDKNFPTDPETAILNGFARAESSFLEIAIKKHEKSGSCAIVLLVVGNQCFIANLGDSRAVVSFKEGNDFKAFSRDHKPSDQGEAERILAAGGEIYRTGEAMVSRILPGRLAISRAFGDMDAKLKELGGNPSVLIALPEVQSFLISSEVDFVCIGSDGVFDRLSNSEVVELIWDKGSCFTDTDPVRRMCRGVEKVISEAMCRMSYDNVTLLCVGFYGFVNRVM